MSVMKANAEAQQAVAAMLAENAQRLAVLQNRPEPAAASISMSD